MTESEMRKELTEKRLRVQSLETELHVAKQIREQIEREKAELAAALRAERASVKSGANIIAMLDDRNAKLMSKLGKVQDALTNIQHRCKVLAEAAVEGL